MGNNTTGFRSVRAGLGASFNLDHNDRYTYTRFRGEFNSTDGVGAVWGVGDNAINILGFPGVNFQMMSIGANGAAGPLAAVLNDGLSITLDSTDNDGFELNLGRDRTGADGTVNLYEPGSFTIGTDAPFFLRTRFKVNTVASYDQAAMGFVVGTYIAAGEIQLESDGFWLNLDNGDVNTESRLNAGGTVDTDSTQNIADNTFVTLEVQVNEDGVAAAFINGAIPTTEIATYTFDSGDVVHADVSAILDASAANLFTIQLWESGFLSTVGREFGIAPSSYSNYIDNAAYVGV